jgi:hypothetical protein
MKQTIAIVIAVIALIGIVVCAVMLMQHQAVPWQLMVFTALCTGFAFGYYYA